MVITSSNGYDILIDEEDFNRVGYYYWQAESLGSKNTRYAFTSIWLPEEKKMKRFSLHRLVINAPSGLWVDHINRNGLDNRKSNLRLVTPAQSACNRGKKILETSCQTPSRFIGVSRNKGRWRARIKINGQRVNLGQYKTEEEAALAYNEAVLKYNPVYGALNNI